MDVHYDSLIGISARIRDREVTSLAVTEALLERIADYDGRLNSALLVTADLARAQAQAADAEIAAGRWRGPLHGVPVGIKDLLWTEGLPTTAGMDLLRDFRPDEDATVVSRLYDAGAVLIAKLHMTEGATLDHHPSFPRPVNPWGAAFWTGSSSSGSGVAPAAGFCFGAIGSDTAGSIRTPSAANSITGIKPTYGRVSRHGAIPLAESLDHLGPMARSALDCAAMLQAIAGYDPKDPTSLTDPVPDYLGTAGEGVRGMTLGIDWQFATRGTPTEVVAALENTRAVLEGRGMRVREIAFPWSAEMASTGALFGSELLLAHEPYYPEHADRYTGWLRDRLEDGAKIRGIDVARAYIARNKYRGMLRAMFAEVDMVLLPGLGTLLPTWDEVATIAQGGVGDQIVRFTSPFNVGGVPTISLPAGFTADGRPIGIQLGGGWLTEPALIRAGVAFQRETHFHLRHPDLDAITSA